MAFCLHQVRAGWLWGHQSVSAGEAGCCFRLPGQGGPALPFLAPHPYLKAQLVTCPGKPPFQEGVQASSYTDYYLLPPHVRAICKGRG